MRFNKTVTVVAFALALTVFGGHNAYATDTKQTLEPGKDSQAHTNTNANTKVDVTVNAGDTLTAIAKAHHTTVEAVMAENSITNANLVEPGQVIKVTPGKEQLIDKYDKLQAAASAFMTPPAPAPQPAATKVVAQTATTYTTRSYSSAPTSSNSRYVGNGMWCTDYVHSRRPDVAVYGNAGYNWIGSAQAAGKATGSAPQAGAVAVTNGHVAYVESVNPDGTYVVSEMGWNYKRGSYNKRTVGPGTFGKFIY
jgi:secretory antigen ssaA homolog